MTFSLLDADVAVAAPLISMGAVLGKTTYMQLIFMGIAELIMFNVNKYVGEHLFMVSELVRFLGDEFRETVVSVTTHRRETRSSFRLLILFLLALLFGIILIIV